VATESFPRPIGTRRRFSALLTATALGVYLLLIVGATTSLTNAAASCSTWPTCHAPVDPLSQTELAIAWAHRLTAVVVGLLVTATALAAILGDASSKVRAVLVVAALLYIVQVGVGAVTATIGPAAILPGLHLALGLVIFSGSSSRSRGTSRLRPGATTTPATRQNRSRTSMRKSRPRPSARSPRVAWPAHGSPPSRTSR